MDAGCFSVRLKIKLAYNYLNMLNPPSAKAKKHLEKLSGDQLQWIFHESAITICDLPKETKALFKSIAHRFNHHFVICSQPEEMFQAMLTWVKNNQIESVKFWRIFWSDAISDFERINIFNDLTSEKMTLAQAQNMWKLHIKIANLGEAYVEYVNSILDNKHNVVYTSLEGVTADYPLMKQQINLNYYANVNWKKNQALLSQFQTAIKNCLQKVDTNKERYDNEVTTKKLMVKQHQGRKYITHLSAK